MVKWFIVIGLSGISVVGLWQASRPKPVLVTVITVDRGPVRTTVANTRAGTVEACRRSGVSPSLGGRVAKLGAREGDRVAEGAILLELWNDDLKAEVELAKSEREAAAARTHEACLVAEEARRDANRSQILQQGGVVTRERLDKAETEAQSRNAGCRAAQAAENVSQARLKAAHAQLARTILTAPFAGVVAEVNGELGEYVTPSPPGIPTPPAIDLIEDGCMRVSAPVDEAEAPSIRPGLPVIITLDAFPDSERKGVVRRVAPYVLDREKQARTLEVEVDFMDAAHTADLLPGYSADIEVVLAQRDNVLRLPSEAVLSGDRVFMVGEQETIVERPFKKGLANWRFTEVLEGVQEGERVITSVGRKGVEVGALVQVEETAKP